MTPGCLLLCFRTVLFGLSSLPSRDRPHLLAMATEVLYRLHHLDCNLVYGLPRILEGPGSRSQRSMAGERSQENKDEPARVQIRASHCGPIRPDDSLQPQVEADFAAAPPGAVHGRCDRGAGPHDQCGFCCRDPDIRFIRWTDQSVPGESINR